MLWCGQILNVGCGAGDNAIFMASKGYLVTALDLSHHAIERRASARVRMVTCVLCATWHAAFGRDNSTYIHVLQAAVDVKDSGQHTYSAFTACILLPGSQNTTVLDLKCDKILVLLP